tara:strand:- start:1004 stop:1231 length:228 start_codon:yes stop_codon:yes gene_type:complete
MTDQNPAHPWAIVAHKGGYWFGTSPPNPDASFSQLLVDLVIDGISLHPVYSREEYQAFMAELKARPNGLGSQPNE